MIPKTVFLSVWTHEPHLPIESDPQFQKYYESLPDADERQHHGNITQLDFAFGKLMAALDEMKLSENTLVIFTADNGPEGTGEKGRTRGSTGGLRGRKRALYEGGIRVPGLVRWPEQIKAGLTSDAPIIGSDWFSTILAAREPSPPAIANSMEPMLCLYSRENQAHRTQYSYVLAFGNGTSRKACCHARGRLEISCDQRPERD